METELSVINGKREDYKICAKCGCTNWYENTECHNCNSNKFKEVDDTWINNEYNFWVKHEGCTEEEANNVCITI